MKIRAVFYRQLVCLLIPGLFAYLSSTAADIKGHITDATSGEPLAGATIRLENTGYGAISGLDGSFDIKDVPAGDYTLIASLLSYKTITKSISLEADHTSPFNLVLFPTANSLSGIDIIGHANGGNDVSARLLEKNSINVENILSAHTIQLLPDITVANVLRRVSGVTVDRSSDGGEGRYPVIRGMDKRYNYTLVNGIKIPSPDDKNRYVPMDMFPSDILQRLEVIKSLTPDMEGDAIGGVMNLVLKDAPDKLLIDAHAALGYPQYLFNQSFTTYDHQAVNSKSPAEIHGTSYMPTYSDFSTQNLVFTHKTSLPDIQAGLTIGNRIMHNKLGFLISGTLQSTDRLSKDLFFELSPQPDPLPNGTEPEITDEQLRTYSTHEDRSGTQAKLDYRINDNNQLSLYALYIQLNTFESRLITDSSQTNRTGPGFGEVTYQDLSKTNKQSIFNITLQGQHSLNSHLSLNWSAVYSRAGQQTPDHAELSTEQTFAADSTGKPTAPAPYLGGLDRYWQHNYDQDIAGYLNVNYKFILFDEQFDLGVGGMYRHKQRSNYYIEYDFNYPPVTTFTNIQSAPYTPMNAGTLQSPNTYDATEDDYAEYGEIRWQPTEKWDILGGIRFENTYQTYNQVEFPPTVYAKSGSVSYMDPLPSVQIKYKLNTKSALHLTYFSSISRPGFFEIVPYVFVGEYYTEVGNYNLKHVKAKNLDLRYELFPGGANQLLIGAFYKNIQNPIEYVYERPATSESVIEPENLGTATNVGAEIVFTQYFHKFGIIANYTYTHSSIPTSYKFYYTSSSGNDTVSYFIKKRPLQGQAAHIGNLSLIYKDPKSGLELQLAGIYTGRHIVYLSQYGAPNGSLDYWQRGTTIIDFSAEKSLGNHFSLYAKLGNLLNTPDIVEIIYPPSANQKKLWPDATRRSDRILVEKKDFGQTYLVGIRYHF